jgi:hypothetical protein
VSGIDYQPNEEYQYLSLVEQTSLLRREAALLNELRSIRKAIENLTEATSANVGDAADMLRSLIEQRGAPR